MAIACRANAARAHPIEVNVTTLMAGKLVRARRRFDRPQASAGTGSEVTDLIFSIAKREVTFFSGTALINFL